MIKPVMFAQGGSAVSVSDPAPTSSFIRRAPAIEIPEWLGKKLAFRQADANEVAHLKKLYEAAWGSGISISKEQLLAQMEAFPEGQIVGMEKDEPGVVKSSVPVSMINILVQVYDSRVGFTSGYERITGDRTFSTHLPLEQLGEKLTDLNGNGLGVALCMSVAVPPEFGKNGYAIETLNYAIKFAEANGLIAVPYSAPRGFAKARAQNPALEIMDYLHMTEPSGIPYKIHAERIPRMNVGLHRTTAAFNGQIPVLSQSKYEFLQRMKPDDVFDGWANTVFSDFFLYESGDFIERYGRKSTIEDFCILTGRRLIDPVMRMHVENGARFIRDGEGRITAVFKDSRPEDTVSAGYNVVLTYSYHRLFGHEFAK